jgi:hypothetical protein
MARKPTTAKRVSRAAKPQRSEDGVDLTLIRWMFSLAPAERQQALQNNARSSMKLRAKRKRTQA